MPYTVWIWDVSKLELVSIISCSNQIESFKWSGVEGSLSVICGNDQILVWKDDEGVQECVFTFHNNKFNIQKMLWSEDGKKILISNKHQLVYVETIAQIE